MIGIGFHTRAIEMSNLPMVEGLVEAGHERVLIHNPHEMVIIAEEFDPVARARAARR